MDPSVKTYLAGYKKCGEMLKTSRKLKTFKVLKEFMQLMPLAQPKPEYTPQISFLAGADQERHALVAHAYSGPLYSDQIMQKVGFSLNHKSKEVHKAFNPATFDKKLAASVLTYMNGIQTGVRPPDVHVGPGAAGSSYAEMIEAFQNLQLHRCPHPQASGDPSPALHHTLHMMDMLNT